MFPSVIALEDNEIVGLSVCPESPPISQLPVWDDSGVAMGDMIFFFLITSGKVQTTKVGSSLKLQGSCILRGGARRMGGSVYITQLPVPMLPV